jgi:hypothetical protein
MKELRRLRKAFRRLECVGNRESWRDLVDRRVRNPLRGLNAIDLGTRRLGGQTEIAAATEATGDTRIMFNVLIQNTDDHLRNLGFLSRGAGKWGLTSTLSHRVRTA